ncbi:MAG: RNA methyltransferase [Oscillospiraceae bacterium]|nr:RNA methyltransferase [Oscillospiraceae bacterium]
MQQMVEFLQTGTKNKTVAAFRHLNRSRNYREKTRCFAMEGARLILDALSSGVRVQALLLNAHAAEQYGDALRGAAPQVRTLYLADALAAEISDTEHAQGVFALAEMPPERETMPQSGSFGMMLHQVQDPSNLGAVLRTAEALRADGLYLYQCVDLYNPKTIRSSMGAMFRLPLTRVRDMDAFFSACQAAGVTTCAAVVDRDAEQLGSFSFAERCKGGACVLIGNEGNGLPGAVSAACDCKMTIPMSPDSNSLNAAMAAGLFLWEMARR